MICPQCGYDMGHRNRCLRCGYEDKELVVIDESAKTESEEPKKEQEEKPEVKVIDPCNVYLTHPYGVEDDYVMFGSPFSSIFDSLFGDPIGDLLGGLFGINLGGQRRSAPRSSRQEEPKRRRKQGPIVEIDGADVEILDENNNPIDKNKTRQQSRQSGPQHKNDKHKR